MPSRTTAWIGVIAAVLGLSGCKLFGGGGGDGGDVATEPQVLPLYDVNLFSPVSRPLTIDYTQVVDLVTLHHELQITHPAADLPGLSGTYETGTGDFTVWPDSALNFNDVGPDPLFGSFAVVTTALWTVPAGEPPTAGALEVTQGTAVTTLIVNATGVTLAYDSNGDGTPEAGPADFTWTQFEDLADNLAAPTWQRLASFGYSASIDFLLKQIGTTVAVLQDINDSLKTTNPRVSPCDAFSATGLIAPSPLPDQGQRSFSWTDTSGDGGVGPGDDFAMQFSDCWQNDFTDNIDSVTDGLVQFLGFTEVVANNTITRVGFEGADAGVTYTDLALSETETVVGNQTPLLRPIGTLNGSFTLVFTQP